LKAGAPKIVVAQPEELSFGFGKVFHHITHPIKHAFHHVTHFAKHTIKVAKHHPFATGALIVGGVGLYGYHAGWFGKTGWLGKHAVGKTVGKAVAKHAVGHAIGKTVKKILHAGKEVVTSPAFITAAAVATGSKICTGDKCYGIDVQPEYSEIPGQYQDYYTGTGYVDTGSIPDGPYTPKAETAQPQAVQAGIGDSLSFLKNPYILGALAVGTVLVLARRN